VECALQEGGVEPHQSERNARKQQDCEQEDAGHRQSEAGQHDPRSAILTDPRLIPRHKQRTKRLVSGTFRTLLVRRTRTAGSPGCVDDGPRLATTDMERHCSPMKPLAAWATYARIQISQRGDCSSGLRRCCHLRAGGARFGGTSGLVPNIRCPFAAPALAQCPYLCLEEALLRLDGRKRSGR